MKPAGLLMLNVFKSLAVATEVHRCGALPDRAGSYGTDTVTLGWEERLKIRGRRRSDGGLEFGTTLPRGTVLREGDCFVLDPTATVVAVVERCEPVLVVRPQTGAEWGLFAYYIGNSHQPVMILDEEIVCADLPGMEQVLEQHAIPFSRSAMPFTPVTLAVDGHRHAS